MIFVLFFCFCLTAVSSSLRTLDMRPDCTQEGLDNCKINNCSENLTVQQRRNAPIEPEWDLEQFGVWMDKHDEFVSVMNVTWIIKAGASIHALHGSEINILDLSTNQNMCVRYSYKLGKQQNPKRERWKFSVDGVVVEPRHTYNVTVFNFPEPEMRDTRIRKQITIPGCDDRRIQNSVMCLQNGSLWDHNMTANVSVDKEHNMLSIVVSFQAAQYSERYQVSIQSSGFHYSKNVSKENRTSLNVTFEFGLCQLSQCELLIMIQPFFIRCKNDCWRPEMIISHCLCVLKRMRMLKRASTLILRQGITTYQSRLCKNDSHFRVHPSVSQALAENKPVVALESTIITHGMPYPHNLSTAKEVEAIVRAEGATPATVGVIEGEVRVGLTSEELDHLARCKSSLKVSRRDLPYVISKGLSGGTTVSATMIAAHQAGISVFVTGGVGGVHRDGENTLDISADLTELGRTPIAVVSAGVKSILDIGRTLEFLETQGVCVATYGASRNFPAFFSPQSGFTSPYQVCNPDEAAKLIASTLSLGLQSGVLLAVPIPEEQAATGQQIEEAIQTAVTEASVKGITGRDVTPFILQKVNDLTKGKSLHANIALIHNNAKVGSQIAYALSKQLNEGNSKGKTHRHGKQSSDSDSDVVVIGGINVDFIAKGKTKALQFGQTNPGRVCQSFGGVGRNIADSMSRLGRRPLFISATGADSHSDAVFNHCKHMNTDGVARLEAQSTATYCVVIDESGEMSLGLGDMDIHQQITEQYVSQFEKQLSSATLVCLDGNIPVSTIDYVCSIASKHSINVWYEPTDSEKARKPFLSDSWKSLSYSSPNLTELRTMNKTLGLPTPEVLPSSLDEVLSVAVTLSRPLLEHLHCVVVTLGANGLLVCGEHDAGSVNLQPRKQKRKRQLCALHYPALIVTAEETVNVSGAGDSLAGALMAGILQQRDTDSCVRMGILAARLSVLSPHPIAPTLTLDSVDPNKVKDLDWPKPNFMWID
ncbi:pseudouridine-metabolizing bifunctional protein C1861.05 [Acanthopagrus latus]|uniref:pseudouridine-metabolizing bifunctional protein C1861.05 n=1 Tax=Acanthopagrus latus TaxID=8177 RepID=UPI00187C0E5C|nr:pseudouridine-metabolizing bifunctional protein C1861.05 [Acanthopagrus latus]